MVHRNLELLRKRAAPTSYSSERCSGEIGNNVMQCLPCCSQWLGLKAVKFLPVISMLFCHLLADCIDTNVTHAGLPNAALLLLGD